MKPTNKARRQELIKACLASAPIHSQAELARRLADQDIQVSQSTLSRDLRDIGTIKRSLKRGYEIEHHSS